MGAAHITRGNATQARIRDRVEHIFAAQQRRPGLIARTVSIVRTRARIIGLRRPLGFEKPVGQRPLIAFSVKAEKYMHLIRRRYLC